MTSKQPPINGGLDVAVVLDQRGQACDVAAPAHDESRRSGVYPWAVDLGAFVGIERATVWRHALIVGAHQRGNNWRTRASPNRSSINITTPWSCWLRITLPAACTTF